MAEILPPLPTPSFALPAQPDFFRVELIERQANPSGNGYRMYADLYHAQANPRVTWSASHPDTRLKPGVLVKPIRMKTPPTHAEHCPIQYLMVLERAEVGLNPFETVPSGWVADNDLLIRASLLWEGLPTPLQGLFNTVFWNADRFQRYCEGPSSLQGHHDGKNGNLRHSVEVAEMVLQLSPRYVGAHAGVAVLAALLHDAGKADEYRSYGSGKRQLSDRGRLWGHRTTVTLWLGVARDRMRLGVPEGLFLSLVHALTAVAGAAPWMGLREPATPEAMLLSMADRASGHADLMNRHMAPEGGWGVQHPHMKTRPFTTPQSRGGRQQCAGLPGLDALMASWQELRR